MLKSGLTRFILGSSSPRRRELLETLGLSFDVVKPDFEEKLRAKESPEDYVLRNTASKAAAIVSQIDMADDTIVICADTIVVLEGKVYEKPTDAQDAIRILNELTGRTHTVMTGFTVARFPERKSVTRLVQTEVTLKAISPAAMQAYIASGEPFDKAGGYAIQGLGGFMVAAINGSYSNVVGLPLVELIEVLEKDFQLALF